MASPERVVRRFRHGPHELSFEVHGRGDRVVVLLHGILLDAGVNRGLAEAVAGRGHRVVLLDLLGHGGSDKPRHAAEHRMDLYADQTVALLDHLRVRSAVVGGVSLGADVALQVAVRSPARVSGLLIEMPVLEWAAPAAALAFVPLLLAAHYTRPVSRVISRVAARIPRTGLWPIDTATGVASLDPDEMAAVLHGVLLGPIAPTLAERAAITAPALVIGHRADLIHPFSDAEHLARQLGDGRFVQARSIAELRTRPARLTDAIVSFLDSVWASPPAEVGRIAR